MNLIIADTYEELSKRAADTLLALLTGKKAPLISPASGDSPAGLYRELVRRMREGQLESGDWNFIGLDEWAGMNGKDEGSCRYHLDQQLFHPLLIAEERICFFDGRIADVNAECADELNAECRKADEFIREHGGIDVAILGLGMNGHIGMNEPGTDPDLYSHVTDIDKMTQEVGQKYFKSATKLSFGITLGIASLLEARHVLLIVSGIHKASIVQRMLEEEETPELPATSFRNHPGLVIILDKDAAQLISKHGK